VPARTASTRAADFLASKIRRIKPVVSEQEAKEKPAEHRSGGFLSLQGAD